MKSISNMGKNVNSDPRYKGGVYANAAGQRRQVAARRTNDNLRHHPLNNGWTFVEFDDQDRAVYSQGPFLVRFLPDQCGWFVQVGSDPAGHLYRYWAIQDVTNELGLLAQEIDLPFMGEPYYTGDSQADDYGLEAVA